MMARLKGNAFSPVLGTTHLNFLNRQGEGRLFEVYPELAGKGEKSFQALNPHPDHRVPCASHPLFRKLLADVMLSSATQGIGDFDVWLTEHSSQCECENCLQVGQMRAEADAVVAAWRQVRKVYPDFGLRIFFSILDEYRMTVEYLMSLPPEIKLGYVYGNRRALDDCARVGRWVAAWNVKAGNHITEIRNHLEELHEGGWKAAYGYAGDRQGIAAVAEWSWNVNGRSPRDFLEAWVTQEGYDKYGSVARVAAWFELIGPLAGYKYTTRHTMRGLAERIRSRDLPARPFPGVEDFLEKIGFAEKALAMARELGNAEWIAQSEEVFAYYRLLRSIDRFAGLLSGEAGMPDAGRADLEAALNDLRIKATANIEASGGKTEFGKEWTEALCAAGAARLGPE
jgi:hypothetical protein